MGIHSTPARAVRFFLIGLIVFFFTMPVFAFCLFECKYFVARKTASALLFFFR